MEDMTWRDSARPVRFWIFDWRLLVALVIWIFWPSLITTSVVLLLIAVFRFAEARGYRLEAALRAMRARFAGRRHALQPSRSRSFVDFG